MQNTQKKSLKVDFKNTLIEAMTSDVGEVQDLFRMNYRFSPLNLLIAQNQLHRRGLPMCALKTFKQWNSVNRKVKKGEKGIYMCRPYQFTPKDKDGKPEKDANGKDVVITGFQLAPFWFAYCQTEGEELNEKAVQEIFDFETALINLEIEKVAFDSKHVNAGGYANVMARKLAVNPQWHDSVQVASTMFHEMGHIVLKHSPTDGISQAEKEIEAESVALLMFKILNIGTLDEQKDYIQHWGRKNEELITDKLARRVFKAVNEIFKAGKGKDLGE